MYDEAVPSDAAESDPTRLRLLDAEAEGLPPTAALTLAVQQVTAGLRGFGALVHLRGADDGTLHLAAHCGIGPGSTAAWEQVPADATAVPARAARARGDDHLWLDGGMGTRALATAAVPLPGPEGPLGALSVLTTCRTEPTPDQWSFLTSAAAWIAARANGLDETGGLSAAPLPAGEMRMGELTAALAKAVTSLDVVHAVQERVLPPFGADGMLVEVIERDRLHVLGSTSYPQEFLDAFDGVPLTMHTAAAAVLRSGIPSFSESPAEFLGRFPQLDELVRLSGKRAWAVLPLIASGRAIGACVVSFAQERVFSNEQRTLLTALSGLVAQALERARLYDREHSRAQELQRGLLPRTLPSLPAVAAGARYLPAGAGDEVGGDWYDVLPLSGDRVALVVGDVMGHGIAEAVTMGRLRTAVRTLADLDIEPDELLARLGDLVRGLGDDWYATFLYAEFDPVPCTLTLCSAGHPLPMVVQPDGTVMRLDMPVDPPLGAAEPPFSKQDVRLPDQCVLTFCTDGLVESASRDIDDGLDLLERSVARALAARHYFSTARHGAPEQALDDVCGSVLSDLLPDRAHTGDDAVLLLAHTRGTRENDVASFALPDDPRAAAQARRHVREQLARWGLAELEMTTELLVSELVGNVFRHASGPARLRLLRSRTLICEVYDGSLTTPCIRRASQTDEGGRGLQLVAAVSRRWGTRFLEGGKCIWAEQEIATA
ncbi:ATP-binding SpoIIE family protein phosphatase [Streptomyces sp. enrichment culture]|uniref:ATP-binding SpoIIE family protein phosphatase n=1 Tax=Streptomyces sp. enrichment culture TaxID=1795815 RepID=UPI003F554D0A